MKKKKEIFKNIDKPLLFIAIFLLVFGLINIVTASSREAVLVNEKGVYYYFYRQIVILFIGFIGSIVVVNIPTRAYKLLGPVLYVITFGMITYCFFMSAKRGAQNWIVIGGFQFQPSELAKPVLIMCISLMFETFYKVYKDFRIPHHKDILGITFAVALLFPSLIFLQKDLGTALIILFIIGIMFIGSPILKKEKITIILLGVLLLVIGCIGLKITKGYILTPAQKARFDFFNPCSKYETGGYQTCNAQIALNDGGLLGLGIGKSKQKYSYIPEPHTDSIFAIIGEEWGVISCLFFIFIPYAFILYRTLDISSNSSTIRGKYISLGIAAYLFAHILINMGGLLGLMPLTGVPLPFLSYGGTYTISLMLSIAMVERIYYETKTKRIKVTN